MILPVDLLLIVSKVQRIHIPTYLHIGYYITLYWRTCVVNTYIALLFIVTSTLDNGKSINHKLYVYNKLSTSRSTNTLTFFIIYIIIHDIMLKI